MVQIRSIREVIVEREFTFPVYTSYWCGYSTVYVKTGVTLQTVEVTIQPAKTGDAAEGLAESGSIEFGTGTGWLPHDTVQEITAEEFEKAVADVRVMLERAVS